MITDAIIDFFLNPVYYLIDEIGLPEIDPIVIPDNAFDVLINIVSPLGYFLPMNVICTCLAFTWALDKVKVKPFSNVTFPFLYWQVSKFIAGAPIKVATKVLAG